MREKESVFKNLGDSDMITVTAKNQELKDMGGENLNNNKDLGGSYGGGLALMWRNEGVVEIKGSCSNYINFEVECEQIGRWRYTGFYGCPERTTRQKSWNILRELASKSQLPWCIVGDFNDMLFSFEKEGGRPHPNNFLIGFGEVIAECGLEDLGFTGGSFTWEKSQGTPGWIQERLDRDEWRGGKVKELKNKIKNCSWMMRKLRSRRDEYGVQKYNEARDEFLKLLERQEIYWKQRSKQFWLREGDHNTRFLHNYASGRKRNNHISKLRDKNGEWVESVQGIQSVIVEYFSEFFASTRVSGQLLDREELQRVTDEQNEKLMQPISSEEVKTTVFSMHADKAPGYDGLNPTFYQAY
ncbi:uncharacterized protein LOC141664599 [Apium graveolens]|uniref:uncharacterized protein LOC141664599 n=1 Tax=Apium graveolens TaxID=4045 RepID=UPI003D7B97B8